MGSPEILIIGGGLTGCVAAVEAVERGRSVVVVEKRAYLGREISAHDHTFVASDGSDDALRLAIGRRDTHPLPE